MSPRRFPVDQTTKDRIVRAYKAGAEIKGLFARFRGTDVYRVLDEAGVPRRGRSVGPRISTGIDL